jgi:hypothetical protein
MLKLTRRAALAALPAFATAAANAAPLRLTTGQRLAAAARAQVAVTRGYDPVYRRIAYPGGDVPRTTGVCSDVIVRAARDALGLDLQKLVHEDMTRDFAAYPSKHRWGLTHPDANIDHRRVLNLEVYWTRQGARLWQANGYTPAPMVPGPLLPGDILTWRLAAGEPHVGMVVEGGIAPRIVHNIGDGAREEALLTLITARAVGRYRWPKA